jgi:hypothetical protein
MKTSTDTAVHREKSMIGVKLADENLVMGLSKTIWRWRKHSRLFCIMETLSYHDLQ